MILFSTAQDGLQILSQCCYLLQGHTNTRWNNPFVFLY